MYAVHRLDFPICSSAHCCIYEIFKGKKYNIMNNVEEHLMYSNLVYEDSAVLPCVRRLIDLRRLMNTSTPLVMYLRAAVDTHSNWLQECLSSAFSYLYPCKVWFDIPGHACWNSAVITRAHAHCSTSVPSNQNSSPCSPQRNTFNEREKSFCWYSTDPFTLMFSLFLSLFLPF